MPASLEQIAAELKAENGLGLLLAAQLGTTPSDLTVALRTATLNQQTGEVSPVTFYTVTMGGVAEHKLTLGAFAHVAMLDDHPILYHHNQRPIRVFIASPATDPEGIFDQIAASYVQVFGQYRNLTDDLNQRTEPDEVLQTGMGLLGTFPEPFAIAIAGLLQDNSIQSTLVAGDPKIGGFKLIAFDNSYFVARQIALETG
jgi:hypothetical protein